jgi:uroporphyrinogen decarboxylase
LYGSADSIEKATKAMLDDAYANGEKTGYIANLGHGITQWVDPEKPKAFIDTVHQYSAKFLG